MALLWPAAWFASYLSGRKQRVKVGSSASCYSECSSGVPQGSVLGPFLFSVYISSIGSHLSPGICHQEFADDITLDTSSSSRADISSKLSVACTRLAVWLNGRGLSLNATKTCVLHIAPWSTLDPLPPVICDGAVLPVVSQTKYLGLIVDDRLTWNSHVTHICKTSRQVIGALWRNRKCLSLQSKRMAYTSMVESRIRYGCSAFFSSLSKANEERLQRLCNLALRAVYNLTSRTRMTPVYAEHNLLRVHQLLRETVCSLVYRCLHSTMEQPLISALFGDFVTPTRAGQTRGSQQHLLQLPSRTRPVSLSAARVWNSLPPDARNITSPSSSRVCCTRIVLL